MYDLLQLSLDLRIFTDGLHIVVENLDVSGFEFVVGVDVGLNYLAVATDLDHKTLDVGLYYVFLL